jgi:hypothetical protein
MKVTLRKAAQIVSQIQNWKTNNTVEHVVSLSRSTVVDPSAVMTAGERNFSQFVFTTLRLNTITASLKNAVGKANHVAGITYLVGELNSVEQSIKFITTYQKQIADPVDPAVVVTLFNNLPVNTDEWRASIVNSHFVTVTVATQLKTELTKLKKQKNRISDELVALNSSNHIVIDAEDYAFLESLDIV